LSDRSGAIEVFADVVPVAGVMGGESTHPETTIKKNRPIHLNLKLRYRNIEVSGWSRGEFAGVFTCIRPSSRRDAAAASGLASLGS